MSWQYFLQIPFLISCLVHLLDIVFFLFILAPKVNFAIMFYRWRILSTKQTWWNWRTLWWLCLARILWLILRKRRYKIEILIILYGWVLASHHTYPDVLESASFSCQIQNFPHPHVGYSNWIWLSTHIRWYPDSL